MRDTAYLVLGGTGLIGSAVCAHLRAQGLPFLSVNSANYAEYVGTRADVVVNCNGNTFRYRARQEPVWDLEKSVVTVERSLFDFRSALYVYLSTVDVYDVADDPGRNHEGAAIDPARLDVYGFHKWVAERVVERFAERSIILRLGTVLGEGLRKGPVFDLLMGQPLHMSLNSELTLIDTATIVKVMRAIIATHPRRDVINLTGTGGARLSDLQRSAGVEPRLAPGAELMTYRYHISNAKIAGLVPMPSSLQVAQDFISAHLNTMSVRS